MALKVTNISNLNRVSTTKNAMIFSRTCTPLCSIVEFGKYLHIYQLNLNNINLDDTPFVAIQTLKTSLYKHLSNTFSLKSSSVRDLLTWFYQTIFLTLKFK